MMLNEMLLMRNCAYWKCLFFYPLFFFYHEWISHIFFFTCRIYICKQQWEKLANNISKLIIMVASFSFNYAAKLFPYFKIHVKLLNIKVELELCLGLRGLSQTRVNAFSQVSFGPLTEFFAFWPVPGFRLCFTL